MLAFHSARRSFLNGQSVSVPKFLSDFFGAFDRRSY